MNVMFVASSHSCLEDAVLRGHSLQLIVNMQDAPRSFIHCKLCSVKVVPFFQSKSCKPICLTILCTAKVPVDIGKHHAQKYSGLHHAVHMICTSVMKNVMVGLTCLPVCQSYS